MDENHPDAHPDPKFTGDMEKDLESIRNWFKYDNYQHGVYRYELDDGYGPCYHMEVTVEMEEEGHTEVTKKWFADRRIPLTVRNVYDYKPNISGIELFQGDISKSRYWFLSRFSKANTRGILIRSNSGNIIDILYP